MLALLLLACSEKAQTSAEHVPQSTTKTQIPARCTESNILSCNFQPFQDLPSGACDQLREDIAGRQIGAETVVRVNNCAPPVLSEPSELWAAAAVGADLEVDGPPSHGAFLFVRSEEGWRLIEPLLDPSWTHGGSCDAKFQLRWEAKGAQFEAILDTQSERVCHMPLDKEEVAAGESDVAFTECRHARYGFRQNKLEKLLAEGSNETCKFN
jgi:hypothetical protein